MNKVAVWEPGMSLCVEVSGLAVATDGVVECVVNFSVVYQRREELKTLLSYF